MIKFAIRKIFPQMLYSRLWGNRKRWGLEVQEDDACWKEWQKKYNLFYSDNQRSGVGVKVNDAGYAVMSSIELKGKTVLEIGAGDIRHESFWKSVPKEYILADIDDEMMRKAEVGLKKMGVPYRTLPVKRRQSLPLEDNYVDVVVSFYSLEHLHPLREYLEDMKRVLKPGGVLMGAIPAEGGLAWGCGRMLTSRRWLKKNTTIDPDKLICWEHPNFADKVIKELDTVFKKGKTKFWPFPLFPSLDTNLIIKFIYTK